ncbi:FtsX-like permease family protein [Blautia wexlerae]|nr:FtsX-like permease family protein [Blautia wexlerae]
MELCHPYYRTDARKRQRGSHGYGGRCELLGVTPELGAEVTVSYSITDKDQTAFTVTDTFTLVGYWDYDELMPVHYINISRDYADDIEAQAVKTGLQPFRTDLNVMLTSGTNIQGQMEQVDTDLGYTWDSYTDPNSVRIGVNWGYTSSQLESQLDPELMIAIATFLLLVIFTGYLIIYNIFQISVAGDIRFYGLLKTIGTTPRQLKRIIRQQALLLCLIGIPAGLLLGYGIGAVLMPVVLHSIQLNTGITTISTSPVIFLGSMLFALLTVLLSCSKPGKMATKVSPVEATKYTDVMQTKKKRRSIRGAKLHQMAFANLGRNKKKDGTGGVVSGTVGDTVQCAVCLCGRLQHGEVCIRHDLRRFYRQHSRLFSL